MRVRAVAALVAAVVLVAPAACSDGPDDVAGGAGGGGTDTFLVEPPGGDGPGGASAGGGVAPPPGEGGGAPGGGGSDGAPAGSGEAPAGSSGGSGGAPSAAPSVDDRAEVGAMGAAFLHPGVPEVVIEIDASPGESLTEQARTALASRIDEHGNKRSVAFAAGSAVPASDVSTTADLRALMSAHRANWSSAGRAAVYVLVLSGRHENDGVVGVAFNASAFAIFPEQLSGGLIGLGYANFEEATVVHELGHLYGLVDLTGHGAFHEDPDHPGHSANSGSVMFWAVESTLVGDVFEGGPPRDFDADDEREIDLVRAAG